uniref:Uncharacterized protein n=1 Tax=Cucumis melo TaxID=3656 RepID=A0A9I9EB87_CUCME
MQHAWKANINLREKQTIMQAIQNVRRKYLQLKNKRVSSKFHQIIFSAFHLSNFRNPHFIPLCSQTLETHCHLSVALFPIVISPSLSSTHHLSLSSSITPRPISYSLAHRRGTSFNLPDVTACNATTPHLTVTVATWNVAARISEEDLEINDWLCTEDNEDVNEMVS